MKKAKVNKKRQYMTLMIVEGNGENVRSIRFPRLVTKVLLGCLLAFTVYTSVITYSTASLSTTYQAKLEDIKSLEETNSNQKSEIKSLNMITAEVREKLKSLEDLEEKVKELVGIND